MSLSDSAVMFVLFILVTLISLLHAQSSSSICAQYYPNQNQQQIQCDCDDTSSIDDNGNKNFPSISLKCSGHSYVPHFLPHIHYTSIELESCSKELHIGDKTFADLHINLLRFRHCNLAELNEQSFGKINHFEKFYIENATIQATATQTGNFQEIFSADSFQKLKILSLKNIHYHQVHHHDKKLNLEQLLIQLPALYRLELINILLDDYRHTSLHSIGKHLIYLNLVNTHQMSILPIEYLVSLERLLLQNLPNVFRTQPLIQSIGKLKHLKYVVFEQNQLTHIQDLQSTTIDEIDLNSNLIETIDEYTFEYVPNLRTLTLTGNPLRTIDKNAFCGVKNLARLYVQTKQQQHAMNRSPLDNCLLVYYPKLQITDDLASKFECNCALKSILQIIRQQQGQINRLLRPNQACLITNETIAQARHPTQLSMRLNSPLPMHELETNLDCSNQPNPCGSPCVERKKTIATMVPSIKIHTATVLVNPKYTSHSSSSFSYSLLLLWLLLFCFSFLYL